MEISLQGARLPSILLSRVRQGFEATFAQKLYDDDASDVTRHFLLVRSGKRMSAESIRVTVSGTLSRAFNKFAVNDVIW